MRSTKGKIAWVTGAGSGIGRGVALALAGDGATVILTGRRREPLEETAALVAAAGGTTIVEPADATDTEALSAIVERIKAGFGRLDLLVNTAGATIPARSWKKLTTEGVSALIDGNLRSATSGTLAVLPIMREQRDGLIVHIASWAGRYVSPVAGPIYTAAKHAVVALSATINIEECANGIRSCAICPAEVSTPIMDLRPKPPSAEDRARMLQPEDLGDLVLYVARVPARVCLNEIVISPTWNRGYISLMSAGRDGTS